MSYEYNRGKIILISYDLYYRSRIEDTSRRQDEKEKVYILQHILNPYHETPSWLSVALVNCLF